MHFMASIVLITGYWHIIILLRCLTSQVKSPGEVVEGQAEGMCLDT